MANCPKCNYKLKLTDWRQTCPKCGANMILYDLQERLMQDADKAEVQHYYFQKKLDRLKASFAGSKFAVIRIFTSILPIIGLLIPFANVQLRAPLPEFSGSMGAINIYTLISDGFDMNAFTALLSTNQKSAALCLAISVVSLLLVFVTTLVHLFLLTLSCSPKGKARNLTLDALIILFTVVPAVVFASMPENSFCSGTLYIGAYVQLLLVAACAVADFLAFRYAKEIAYKPCFVGGIPAEEYFQMVEDGKPQDEIRAEMYRRLTILQQEKEAELARKAEEEQKKAEVTAS